MGILNKHSSEVIYCVHFNNLGTWFSFPKLEIRNQVTNSLSFLPDQQPFLPSYLWSLATESSRVAFPYLLGKFVQERGLSEGKTHLSLLFQWQKLSLRWWNPLFLFLSNLSQLILIVKHQFSFIFIQGSQNQNLSKCTKETLIDSKL